MANQLKLEVLLAAVDKVTRPLKAMTEGAGKTSQEMKKTKERLGELNRQAGLIDGFRKNSAELSKTSAQLDNAKKKANRLAKEFKATENPTKQMEREMAEARKTVLSLDQSKTRLTRTVQEQRAKLEQNGVSTKNLSATRSRLRQQSERLNSTLSEQKERLEAVTKQQQRLNQASKAYRQAKDLQGRLAGGGSQAMAAGGGALALMAAPAVMAEMQGSRIAAQMGEAGMSDEYQVVIRQVYESGAGEGIESVGEAVSAVSSSLGSLRNTSQADLAEMTRQALTLSRAYGVDVAESTQTAAILVRNGLARNAGEAFDLMTRGMQNVSSSMRGELPEILHEYSTNFRALGFSGNDAFNMLIAQAEKGKFALDKTGDALKEFTIRGADMSAASSGAYEAIGMDAARAAAAVAEGGAQARAVLAQTAEGLLAVQDPAERANLAIALFGTPLEDLSVDQIPDFLRGLGNIEDRVGDVAGASREMDDALRNNAGDALLQIQRVVSGSFMGLLKDVSADIISVSNSFKEWAQENPELVSTITKVAAVVAVAAVAGGALALTIAGLLGPIAAVRWAMTVLSIKTMPGLTVASKAAGAALLSTAKSSLVAAKSLGLKAWAMIAPRMRAAALAGMMYVRTSGLIATAGAASKAALLGVGKAILTSVLAPLKFLKLAIMGVSRALIMNPIGAIIAAIAVAALLIYKYWEPIKAFFVGVWQGFREAFAPIGQLITGIFSDVGQVLSPIKPLWDGIASVLGKVWGWVSQLFKPFQATSEGLEGATSAGRLFGKVFTSVFLFVPKLVLGAVKMVIGIFKSIPSAVATIWNGLKKIFWWSPIGLIIKGFSSAFTWLGNIDWAGIAGKAWEKIKTVFKWSPLGLIYQGFSAAFNWLSNIDWSGYASAAWDKLKQLFWWSPIGLIIKGFSSAFTWLGNIDWAGAAAAAWDGLKTIFKWSPLGLIIQGFSAAFNWLSTLPEKFSGIGSAIIDGLISGITGMLGQVKDTVVSAASSVAGWFKDVLGINSPSKVFMTYGDDTMNGLAVGLNGNDEPVKAVTRTTGQMRQAAAGLALTAAVAMPVAAEPASDIVRNIRYQEDAANVTGIQDQVQRIRAYEIERNEQREQVAPNENRQVKQDNRMIISEGAIVISVGNGANAQDIAAQIRRELQLLERQRDAENRSKLMDLD